MVKMLGADRSSVNFNFLGWSNLCRVEVRMRLMAAVATMVAEAIGVIDYREVAAKLGEMATYCEVWRHAMEGVEHQARPTATGQWTLGPARDLHAWFTQVSGRMAELMREICASGIIGRNRIHLLRGFDQSEMKGRIKELLQRPLPHGEIM